MRVLFFSEAFWPHVGGIETFGKQLMTGLQPRGVEFAILTNTLKGQSDEDDFNGIPVYRVPFRQGLAKNPALFAKALVKIQEIKNTFQPDVVHLNTNGPSFYYHLMSASAHPSATLFTLHFFVEDMRSQSQLLQKMLAKSDWVNGVSQSNLEQAQNQYPVIKNKSSVIHNGLEMPSQKPENLNRSPQNIFCWGRLEKYKGFDVVLRAYADILPRYPHSRLQIAGDGPEAGALMSLVKDLEITDHVTFLGYLAARDLAQKINQATVVVVPSRAQECFGLVALEAMQRERPVLASRFGGLEEVVVHEKTGLLFEVDHVAALTTGISRIFDNPQEAEAWGRAGRERAQQQFSLKKMCDQYREIYQGIMSRRHGII